MIQNFNMGNIDVFSTIVSSMDDMIPHLLSFAKSGVYQLCSSCIYFSLT